MKIFTACSLMFTGRLARLAIGVVTVVLAIGGTTLALRGAEAADQVMSSKNMPKDETIYSRGIVPEDLRPFGGAAAAQGASTASAFVVDPIVNNVNVNLITTDPGGWSEPSIAV